MTHELKIQPKYFETILSREKTFEIRKNDRGFEVGDTVVLKEYTDKKGYTGNYAKGKILFMTDFNQKRGYIVFSYKLESSGFDYKYKKGEK